MSLREQVSPGVRSAAALEPRTLSSVTVVVPALNEEDNLRPAVEAVLKEFGPLASELEVLVFDDASTDRTGTIADALAAEDARVRAVHNRGRLNIGGIYKAGLARAHGDYYVLVPGDNETRVDEIVRGARYLDRADVVVFHVTNSGVRTWDRRLLSWLYVRCVNTLFGTRFLYTNGTNIFRTEVVRRLPILTNGFSYQTEAVVKAAWSGVDFVQVGMELKPRDFGTSKALTWRNLEAVVGSLARLWWNVRVRERRLYRRRGRLLSTV